MSAQGVISQVIGPVVDIRFPEGAALPKILDALVVQREGGKLILETQKHIGEDTVRAIAMEATEGLSRGMAVEATGTGITMPTGEGIKGGLFNVVGEAIDGIANRSFEAGRSIHQAPPKFEDLSTSTDVLFTASR